MTNYITQRAHPYAIGIDTVATLTAENVSAFMANGYSFVVRYLGSLTTIEVDTILNSGMAVMPVTYSRAVGWSPSAALGVSDGNLALTHLTHLNLPKGVTVWCDLEGVSGTSSDSIAYANAWASIIQTAGYVAGVYVGADIPLNSEELYKLNVHAYWQSCSVVPEVDVCGYMMIQLSPPDVILNGVEVDVDVIEQDHSGRLPSWTVLAP